MPSTLGAMTSILLSGAFSAVGWAQTHKAPLTVEELPCSFCHTCDKPTRTQPCLRRCPRTSAAAVAKAMAGMHSPDVVILNELEDLYLPVPFDHKGHAQMAEMTDACAVCHHYTPEGAAHPACKHCHEIAPKREDIRKPSLKAAYHRQCMSCHREWSHETGCAICHPPKVGTDGTREPTPMPTKDDIVGQMHPPIPEPHTEIYQPRSKPKPGDKVIFRHKEHTQRFGLKCAECHREESCSRCHEVGRKHEQRERTPAEHHRPCSICHDVANKNACDRCHWKEGEAKPKPFDHADVGWELSDHHAQLSCRTCHEAVPFEKLDRACNVCHGDWAPDSFDHKVTGQMLDKNHEEIACEDCHAERKFDRPPKCDECHDEDDGISFPARRPGPLVIPFHHVGDRTLDD